MIRNMDSGMTQERYLQVCEQLGKEPSPLEMPPDIHHDFPQIVGEAYEIFNRLGDRYNESVFVGKDYGKIELYLDIYGIDDRDKELLLDLISFFEGKAIAKSVEQVKKQMKQAGKGKGSG